MTMNEKAWDIKRGKERTEGQHKRDKKSRPHYVVKRKWRWNKKISKREKSKKGSRDWDMIRCD